MSRKINRGLGVEIHSTGHLGKRNGIPVQIQKLGVRWNIDHKVEKRDKKGADELRTCSIDRGDIRLHGI